MGAAPSCAILIVINADRSVSVLGDATIGPYDGGDDSLVGIQNNSSQPVDAITVSGPAGSGIFGFDGDGLCTFITVPCGATGYEGPGTAFVRDLTNSARGEVGFGSGGLAAASSTYFSLEGVLTAAALKVRQGHLATRYVALGDSYSSGEGNPPFLAGTEKKCDRSNYAYGPLIKTFLNITKASDFSFQACSGAIMADFVANLGGSSAGQYADGPQLDVIAPANKPDMNTGLVTLSVGGNDVGFPFVLADCVMGTGASGSPSKCSSSIASYLAKGTKLLTGGGRILVSKADNSFKFCDSACAKANAPIPFLPSNNFFVPNAVVTVPSLAGLYGNVHQRAPDARVRILLYPHLFPANPKTTCVVGQAVARAYTISYTLTVSEMKALNDAGDKLNKAIQSQVDMARMSGIDIATIDPRSDFAAGHELCDSDPWINSLTVDGPLIFPGFASPSPFSFHPNVAGQQDFATDFESNL